MSQMKVDNYTKSVLTLIAICLAILTLKQLDLFPKAYAGGANQDVILPGANYGLVPLNADGSISVKLIDDEIDVNITDISTTDELEVNIEEVGDYSIYGGNLPVKIVE